MRLCISIIALCAALNANAQTYTEHVQTKQQGQGTVTINQSKEIDELVNGKIKVQQNVQTPQAKQPTVKKHDEPKPSVTPTETNKPQRGDITKKETDDTDIPVVDMRKKVMTKSYNITGYRVQAFVGGNSRKDKQKAQQTGNSIKMAFPDQPIYVHFYSPRWICRVGNFRTYEEANSMLQQIKDMGYKSASIVKGKITVQY